MAKAGEPDAGLKAISIRAGKTTYTLGGQLPAGVAPRSLAQEAMRWSYVLRARERWVDNEEARSSRHEDARATLHAFGLGEADLQRIAQEEQVVVRAAYRGEAQDWAARVFPWEYVISTATRNYRSRRDRRFAIMRELLRDGKPGAAPKAPPQRPRFLYVQSAPGRLAEAWDFEGEFKRLQAGVADAAELRQLKNPSLQQLAEELRAFQPELVHLSGFDNVQGLRALRELAGPQTLVCLPWELSAGTDGDATEFIEDTLAGVLKNERALQDGYLMATSTGRPCMVTAVELAETLAAGSHRPLFVGASVANSASRTAALLVGEGAALAAVGFQGDIDSSVADYFFELYYAEFLREWNVSAAFQRSWAKVRFQPQARRATGIVLWSAAPLDAATKATAGTATLVREGKGLPTLDVVPVDELNYAVLHNTRPGGLFKSFVVERNGAAAGERIEVDVELHLGQEQAAWRKCFLVADEDRWDLAGEIHVPLTAGLVRSVREAVNSSVVVQLRVQDTLLARQSHRLRLLPVDQWRDNDKDGQWLPSFVLPRDAAAMRAVQQAQRYVRVLRDDPSAGFEGYQVAGDAEPGEDALTEVDLQVQAIWATLVHEWQLGYINPPPTYSTELDSQRLRTPSAVQRNAAGTCIDLALLLAACLELVDIYPVIFLLDGHALPGYWRHHSFHAQFNQAIYPDEADAPPMPSPRSSSAGIQKYPWQTLGRDAHRELARCIEARQLVPIETVRLTEYCGFVHAIEAGVEALASVRDFHSMLDIVRARQHGVTPLPIVEAAP